MNEPVVDEHELEDGPFERRETADDRPERRSMTAFIPTSKEGHQGVHFCLSGQDGHWVDLQITVVGCVDNVTLTFHSSHHDDEEAVNRMVEFLDSLSETLDDFKADFAIDAFQAANG